METIEEVVEKRADLYSKLFDNNVKNAFKNGFIAGVNWQKEQHKLELECIRSFIRSEHLSSKLEVYSKEWFEQNNSNLNHWD